MAGLGSQDEVSLKLEGFLRRDLSHFHAVEIDAWRFGLDSVGPQEHFCLCFPNVSLSMWTVS